MKRFRPVQFDEEAAHFVRVGQAVHQCKGIDPGRSVNVFAVVDEQIDLAEARIRRGERPSVVFAVMRAAVARMRKATY